MRKVKLGSTGLEVSRLGLGCMGMTPIYGAPDPSEVEATLLHAVERGCTFIDTADVYSDGKNEEIVGRVLAPVRDRVVLATKFGNVRYPDGRRAIDGSPAYVQRACEASLQRLGVEVIDLYYQHRVDPNVPIEETVGAMARLIEQGKVRHLGLSEAAAPTIRRAHATHPIAAVQSEYSLWTRDLEADVLPTCRELGIGFVPYSPLGRGYLTGTIRARNDLDPKDRRLEHPRFAEENLDKNAALLVALDAVAGHTKSTPAQVALAWVLSRGDDVVPIPGTKRRRWLDANIEAVDLRLDPADLTALEQAFPPGVTAGTRYPAPQMKAINL